MENQVYRTCGAEVVRCAGATVTGTACDIFRKAPAISSGSWSSTAYIATNAGYWDALTGAALCGKNNAVLLLVSDRNRAGIDSFVEPHMSEVSRYYLFGGNSAVSADTERHLSTVLDLPKQTPEPQGF